MQAHRIRQIFVHVSELHRLCVEMGIERPNVIFVVVKVKLRLCAVNVSRAVGVEYLEVFAGERGVPVGIRIADAEFLRGVAVGSGVVLRVEILEVVRIADFGVVGVKTPVLLINAGVTPEKEPAVGVAAVGVTRRFVTFVFVVARQIVELYQTGASLRQITELILPLQAAPAQIVRRNGGVHLRRDVPVIGQRELEAVIIAVFRVRDQEARAAAIADR